MAVPLNLTPDATGLKDWSCKDFERAFTTGMGKNGKKLDVMEVASMSDSNPEVTRRRLLVIAGSAIALLGATSCKKGPSSCTDVTGLTPEEVQTRKTVAYVDKATDATKTCEKCQQYTAPPSSDQCGGCKVLKGPIHPEGYCTLFVAKL